MKILSLLILLTTALNEHGASAPNSNWPQWRGPLATGEAPNATPPQTWSETEHVKWKVKIPGSGTSTPIIWGDQVFIQTAIATGKKSETKNEPAPEGGPRGGPGRGGEKPTETFQFTILALDRATGKTLWQKVAREEIPHEGHHQDHGFSSYSPITDGTLLFAYFGSRGIHAYDMQGNLKWEKDLGHMQTKMGFGEGSSPALFGDTLVINWDHEGDDFIVALDKNTGKELWKMPRQEDTSWSTPLIVQHEGKSQVVTTATKKIRSYDLADGKLLWECTGMTPNTIPSPVPGKDMIYATSGFRGSSLLAIRLGKGGDLTGTDAIAWSRNKGTPYVPSPLLYQERLYVLSGNNGVLSSFDAATGKPVLDAERIEALPGVYASPVAANGNIYLVGRTGTSVVLKAAADKLEILATNKLDEKFDASPAISGKALFLRGHQYLYCISE
jgi:outer membrane protein assembly factor BamB